MKSRGDYAARTFWVTALSVGLMGLFAPGGVNDAVAQSQETSIEGRLKYLADDFEPDKDRLFISVLPADAHVINTDNVGNGPGEISDPHRLQRRWQYNGNWEVVYRLPNILNFNVVFWRFFDPQNPVEIALEVSADNVEYSPIEFDMLGAKENWKLEEVSLQPSFDGDPDDLRRVEGDFQYLKIKVSGGLAWHAQIAMVEMLGYSPE